MASYLLVGGIISENDETFGLKSRPCVSPSHPSLRVFLLADRLDDWSGDSAALAKTKQLIDTLRAVSQGHQRFNIRSWQFEEDVGRQIRVLKKP